MSSLDYSLLLLSLFVGVLCCFLFYNVVLSVLSRLLFIVAPIVCGGGGLCLDLVLNCSILSAL